MKNKNEGGGNTVSGVNTYYIATVTRWCVIIGGEIDIEINGTE